MSDRADRLRAEADLVEREDQLAEAMAAARETYRVDPSDANKAMYRAAVEELESARKLARAGRAGVTVVAGG